MPDRRQPNQPLHILAFFNHSFSTKYLSQSHCPIKQCVCNVNKMINKIYYPPAICMWVVPYYRYQIFVTISFQFIYK